MDSSLAIPRFANILTKFPWYPLPPYKYLKLLEIDQYIHYDDFSFYFKVGLVF